MKMRWCYEKHIFSAIKFTVCSLIIIFYITFLCRESQNAYELNKVRTESHVLPQKQQQQQQQVEIILHKRHKSLEDHQIADQLQQQQQEHKQQQQTDLERKQQTLLLAETWPIPPTTLNPIYEYSEEIHSAIEKDLQQRKQHLQQHCAKNQLLNVYPPNPREFFISPGHNLIWCNVFKAASSTWMYYFNILGGYDTKYLQRTVTQPLQLARKRFPRPHLQELLDCLTSSLSFLFVRDPFERIVSGYRNKLEGGKNTYYKWLSTQIVRRYRKHITGAGHIGMGGVGNLPKQGPTFNEFVHYLIDENKLGKAFDEHWAPIYKFCTPCSIDFNIVGKVETFARDSEFIIRQAGLESLLLDTLPKSKLRKIANIGTGDKTDALVKSYFAEINRSTLMELLNIYRLDFELFDYDYQKYFDYIIPESSEIFYRATSAQQSIYNFTH